MDIYLFEVDDSISSIPDLLSSLGKGLVEHTQKTPLVFIMWLFGWLTFKGRISISLHILDMFMQFRKTSMSRCLLKQILINNWGNVRKYFSFWYLLCFHIKLSLCIWPHSGYSYCSYHGQTVLSVITTSCTHVAPHILSSHIVT